MSEIIKPKDYSIVPDHSGKTRWGDISEGDRRLGLELKYLKKTEPEKLREVIASLSPSEAEDILYNVGIWARDSQLFDFDGNWIVQMWLAGRGAGKANATSTPILTPNGFVKLGDLKVGDTIYDEKGDECQITATYDMTPEVCYRLHFSDDSYVDCCEDHQWTTWEHKDRKAYNRLPCVPDKTKLPDNWVEWRSVDTRGRETGAGPTTKTTQQIVDTFYQGKRGDLNHSIPITKPVKMKAKDLEFDPYILGYWFGNGTTGRNALSVDIGSDREHLMMQIESAGYTLGNNNGKFKVSMLNITQLIKSLGEGVFEEKKIPQKYLLGSIEQRLALLQGFMDSDGYIEPSGKTAEFCAKRKEHAEAVKFLIDSLGYRSTLTEGRAMLNGKDYGTKYRVFFRPVPEMNPFRLPRKRDLVIPLGSQASRHLHRMITKYERIENVPMRCLTVNSPSHLFLCNTNLIPTHNTFTLSATVKRGVENYGIKKITCITQTARDIRATVVPEIEARYPSSNKNKPKFNGQSSSISWPNGANCLFISAEAGEDAPRGTQCELLLGDEIAFYGHNEGIITQALLTNRLGNSKAGFFTTPSASPYLIKTVRKAQDSNQDYVKLYKGSTFDNEANLSRSFIESAVADYKGTRLERVELYGEIVLESDGALLKPSDIEPNMVGVETLPEMLEIGIGIDPSISANKTVKGRKLDSCGIIVSGKGSDGKMYVLENATLNAPISVWAKKAVDTYYKYRAIYDIVKIRAESNTGGSELLSKAFDDVETGFASKIDFKYSTVSKLNRAMPYALMVQQNKIKFVDKPEMNALIDELTSYDGTGKSPDSMDAWVFSLNLIAPIVTKSTTIQELII